MAFLRLFRLERSIMVSLITGVAAYVAGAGTDRSLLMMLAGWFLAVGGFSLDFVADRTIDKHGPRAMIRLNPVSDGSIAPLHGLLFSLFFIAASLVVTCMVSPASLLCWVCIVSIFAGLALHRFEGPFSRAVTLGGLQALYFIMGGMSGKLTKGIWLLAAMFFFAMTGGRWMTDVRDYLQDKETPVRTLPQRIGIARSAWMTFLFLLISYGFSYAAVFTGEFGRWYLYLDIAFIAIGVAVGLFFVVHPTPRVAQVLVFVFMMGLGTLILLAMVLGKACR